jgi:FkbM family methyltransferase
MKPLCERLLAEIVDHVWPETTTVLIYGAGHTGHLVAQCLSAQGIKVEAFLDHRAAAGQVIDGIPVLRAEEAGGFAHIPVLVAVFNPLRSSRFSDIANYLNSVGFKSVCSLEQFYLAHPHFFPNIYWLTDRTFYKGHWTDVMAVDELWADVRSRELYRALIEHRTTGRTDCLPEPDALELQYVPDDVPLRRQEHNFIDIGAFDGDTLEALRGKKWSLKRVLAFEPDMNNFKKLCERVNNNGPYAEEVILIPAGVGDQCMTLGFSGDASSGSKVVDIANSGFHIPVVALDAAVHGFAPSYIKMDIEGAEESALMGMRDTIMKNRPTLAISAYHRPQDIFAIPLLLKGWGYSADFYLRMYGEHTFETVLYAIPK